MVEISFVGLVALVLFGFALEALSEWMDAPQQKRAQEAADYRARNKRLKRKYGGTFLGGWPEDAPGYDKLSLEEQRTFEEEFVKKRWGNMA